MATGSPRRGAAGGCAWRRLARVRWRTGDGRRLTELAAGGGCACKVPAGELDGLLATLELPVVDGLLTGVGEDAAVVRLPGPDRPPGTPAVVATTDFFTPVVDDPYDWGRIAATNALSDVWAVGGEPLVALNLLVWSRELLDRDVVAEVLRGGADVLRAVGCALGGGHSVTGPEPLYGLAVTGTADPDRLLREDAARPGDPLTLTKPVGVGVLNNRAKTTGEASGAALEVMTGLNRDAARAALAAGARCATDVTGFGLLGHADEVARASGVALAFDAAAVPVLDEARHALAAGHVPGGSRRNLDHVRPRLAASGDVDEDLLLLLADAQTSGGLLVAAELPGHPVVGEVVAARDDGCTLVVR